jgi:ribosomal protein L37E
MTNASPRCYLCRRATVTEILGPVSAEDSPFTLTIFGLPVQICENGHRHFAHSTMALQHLVRLTEERAASVPNCGETGRLFKRATCTDCGARLARAEAQRQIFRVQIDLTETAGFGIDVTSPVYRCRRCGKKHLPRKKLQSRAPGAMVKALRSVGVGR